MNEILADISLGFTFFSNYDLIYCEVIMREGYSYVLFNSKIVGTIAYSENMEWEQILGDQIPIKIMAEIVEHINLKYL